jgi:hypothetical protein
MANRAPIIGAWYEEVETGDVFEVVAVDEDTASIEIQYVGGELSELDFESWGQMVLLRAEAPEDMNASYELSNEDMQDYEDIRIPDFMDDPLSSIESDSMYGFEEY